MTEEKMEEFWWIYNVLFFCLHTQILFFFPPPPPPPPPPKKKSPYLGNVRMKNEPENRRKVKSCISWREQSRNLSLLNSHNFCFSCSSFLPWQPITASLWAPFLSPRKPTPLGVFKLGSPVICTALLLLPRPCSRPLVSFVPAVGSGFNCSCCG